MAKTVTLIDREGRAQNVSTPLLVNQLVFGQGYKVAEGTVDEAIAYLGSTDPEPEPAPEPAPDDKGEQPVVATAKPRTHKPAGEPAGESTTDD